MSTNTNGDNRPIGLTKISEQVNENIKSNKHVSFGGGAIVNSEGEVLRVEYYCPPGSKLFNFFLKHRDEIQEIIKQETAQVLNSKSAKKSWSSNAAKNRPVVKSLMMAESVFPQPNKPILFLPRNDLKEWFPRFLEAVYKMSGTQATVPSVFPCPLHEWDGEVDKIMTRDELLLLGPEARLSWKLPRRIEGVTHYYQTNTFLWKLRLVAALILRRYGINFNTFAKEVTKEDRGYNLLSEDQIIGLQDQDDLELTDFLNGSRAVLSFEIGDFIVETNWASRIDAPVYEVGDGYILREFHVEYAKGNYIGYYCTSQIEQMTGASEGNYSKIKIVKKTEGGGKNKHVTRFLSVDQQETEQERSARKSRLEQVAVEIERTARKAGLEQVEVEQVEVLDQDDVKEMKNEILEYGDEEQVVVLDQEDLEEMKIEVLEIKNEDPDDPLEEEPVKKKSRLTV